MATETPELQRRRRVYEGPAFLSYGFRPFFLLGSILAGLVVLVWVPVFYGYIQLILAIPPLEWHIHELLYGYLSAAVVGFLLTAIPNWTGRMPVSGWRLAALASLWLAGRFAILFSGLIGWWLAAIVDASFLLVFIAVAAREVIAGKNYRNLKVLSGVSLLAVGNITFLLEVGIQGAANYGIRIGIAGGLALVMLIGGRIIPSFTRNWLVRENPGRIPVPFNRFDGVAMAVSLVALLSWIVWPFEAVTGVLFIAAGILQLIRLARWAGDRTVRDRLVLILHIGYFFVPLGFLIGSLGVFGYILPSTGTHAWTAGAFGLMTLAVMSRATLGHSGRTLKADTITQLIYVLAIAAALLRICAALLDSDQTLMFISGGCWCLAFFGFAVHYAPLFLKARR